MYLEPSVPQDDSLSAAASVAHTVTGVDKLHEQGIYGKGVKIGVVDTGIWYNHDAVRDEVAMKVCVQTVTHESSSEVASERASRLLVATTLLEISVSHPQHLNISA